MVDYTHAKMLVNTVYVTYCMSALFLPEYKVLTNIVMIKLINDHAG